MTVIQEIHVEVPITSPGGDYTEPVWVIVYDTREAMLAAAHEWNGHTPEGGDQVDGVTQGNSGFILTTEPRAVVRLWAGAPTRPVLLHELVHATQHVFAHSGMLADLPTNPWGLDNEDYAHLLGGLYPHLCAEIDWSLSTTDPNSFPEVEDV